ncbi:gamma-glutamyltransferase [Rhodopseudomonas pseudopalustris]|uniref:Glutathione hydrolase proenzyme n=1 Tax=Rhodopseudomonas pseudopalustris TaxID=1513892 RepID=A0A1H8W243_9BRAD|nr:gamma-glutamyltransferase [Rhodopseudomonas pseudopalustris]SEP21248.1 gamma-glutamyltransferase 1 Threonine peptidase. MEROPS family T03 [Rhodopseudomonas pseudopalustris]
MAKPTAMIVAAQAEAAEAGASILQAGGNAVDAAVACALVQGVVDPLMAGIAGFGSASFYLPGQQFHKYLDFHAPAPAAARPEMWEHLIEGEARDGYGFILKGKVNDIGYQSVCVPASLKALHAAHVRFGALPWRDVVAPAIDWAERGWMVRPHVELFWSDPGTMGRAAVVDRLTFSASGRRLYCRDDGTPKRVGDLVHNPDYANTLRMIADGGSDVFYKGELGRRIVSDMRQNGGLITAEDLAAYEPKWFDPLRGSYRGHDVTTNNPPGGGLMLIEMLNILEQFDLAGIGHNSAEYIRIVCEAMKRATVDKDNAIGDPSFVDVPVAQLASKDYAAEVARNIVAGGKIEVPRFNSGFPSKDTTHVSVVDRDGNCVTMTHSLGMPSGVITEGLGFFYNGCMAVFDPRPGRAGSIAPGKARFTSVCPSIVFRDAKPYLVIGAPGATQIAMGVLQAILNVIDFDMTMTEAVSAPRFSATSNSIDVTNRITHGVARQLKADGYEVIRSPYTFGIAAVHGIRIDGDRLDGGADPGHDGLAIGV